MKLRSENLELRDMVEVIVKDEDLQQAALEGMDEFLDVFVKAIYDAIGGELTAESMAQLNADQLTLLAWNILHEEVMDGGFVQLIYNGYGPFIFKNPLAKALRQWDMRAPSKLIYDAHTLWLKYREEIETEKSDEDFMAMFEQYPEFENLMISLSRTRKSGPRISPIMWTITWTTSRKLKIED